MIVGLIDKRRGNAFYCKAHRRRGWTATYHAGCRMGIRLELAAGTQCLVVKSAVLGNGNGDAAVGHYHSRGALCMVSVVPSLSP